MCQYSCTDGVANDWHFVHLASRAVGGAALVFTEAAAVTAEGRISPQDLGIWNDAQADALAQDRRIHRLAGRRRGNPTRARGTQSLDAPAVGRPGGAVAEAEGGWARVDAPSAIPFSAEYLVPHAMTGIGHRRVRRGVCRRRPPGARGRLPGDRASRRARLPAPRISLAAQQHAHGPLRWIVREPDRVSSAKSRSRFAACGPARTRCSRGSPPPTGPTGAGICRSRSNLRAR